MSNELHIHTKAGSMVVRFARPEIRSPLSIATLLRLHEIVRDLTTDSDVDKLIFTGVNDVFASGADLREIAAVSAANSREFALRGQTLMSAIDDLPQMTVAAINGYCFGGALDLALACKKRIASPNAMFSHPGAGLGIITGWGGTQRLPRLVGEAFALEMLITGKRVDAGEALLKELVDAVADNPLAAAITA